MPIVLSSSLEKGCARAHRDEPPNCLLNAVGLYRRFRRRLPSLYSYIRIYMLHEALLFIDPRPNEYIAPKARTEHYYLYCSTSKKRESLVLSALASERASKRARKRRKPSSPGEIQAGRELCSPAQASGLQSAAL